MCRHQGRPVDLPHRLCMKARPSIQRLDQQPLGPPMRHPMHSCRDREADPTDDHVQDRRRGRKRGPPPGIGYLGPHRPRRLVKAPNAARRPVHARLDAGDRDGDVADHDAMRRLQLVGVDVARRIEPRIMNPGVVDDYRRGVKSLSRTLEEAAGVEQAEVKQRLRDLIEGVKIRPTNTDWDI